jgi:hypothetical protein
VEQRHVARQDFTDVGARALRDVRCSKPIQVLGLGPRELRPAERERHASSSAREVDGRLDRDVATPNHQDILTRKVLRVVKAVRHLVEIFTGNAELPVGAASPDRDQHAPGADRLAFGETHGQRASGTLDVLSVCGDRRDSRCSRLGAQLFEQRFLHVSRDLQRSRGPHALRIGEDRLSSREIRDREERLRALEDRERQAETLGLDRGRHAGNPRAHDREVEDVGVGLAARSAQLDRDSLDHLGSRVESGLEERDAGQIPRHEDSGHVRAAVRAHVGQLLDRSRGPSGVQPPGIARQEVGHFGNYTRAGQRCDKGGREPSCGPRSSE